MACGALDVHQANPPTPPADRREHARVEIPLEVELEHPCMGRRRCRVRDLSQDGLFLEFPGHELVAGARLRVTPIAPSILGHDHCPTVEIEVARIADDGLGTRFANRTQAYLFNSFRQRRTTLEVGIDYFQIHVAAVVTNEHNRLLVVDDHGRWVFPGTFLVVGQNIERAVADMLLADLALELTDIDAPLATTTLDGGLAPEAATLAIFQRCRCRGQGAVGDDGRYRRLRWLAPGRDPYDLVFADPILRDLARKVLLP